MRLLLIVALATSACTFKFDVTGQRTALENQVMGAYKELDDDVILASSVRAPDPKAAIPKLSAERAKAVDARQNQMFNRDDIEELKDKEILGEAADGSLVMLPGSVVSGNPSPQDAKLAAQLVVEENQDRATVWQRVIDSNENLDAANLPEVRKTYAKLQRDQAAPEQWVQDEAGTWRKKQAEIQ